MSDRMSPRELMLLALAVAPEQADDVPTLARRAANRMVTYLAEPAIQQGSPELHRIAFLIDMIALLEAMRIEDWMPHADALTWEEIDISAQVADDRR